MEPTISHCPARTGLRVPEAHPHMQTSDAGPGLSPVELETARALAERWDESVAELGAEPLPLTHPHAVSAGSLDWEHRDPFDRLLAAQAIAEGLTLVTADRAFRGAPGLVVQPW